MPKMHHVVRVLEFVLIAGVAAGCGVVAGQTPAEKVATRIRDAASPLVSKVVYRPATFLDEPRVDVSLRPGATESQAEALWCEIVVPAGGNQDPEETGTVVWNDSGTEMMALDAVCSN
jgi:hypothetical protein